MQNRSRLLMAASALLYLGPLLAGLSGMGWAAVPVFIALFALWLVVMRPAKWPRDLAQWTSATVVAAAAQVAVNALIVIALFGIGRGIGGVAGVFPNIPPLIPVALSILATPLSRLAWDPTTGAKIDHLVDEPPPAAKTSPAKPGEAPQDEMVTTLLELGPDVDPMLTADAIDAALRGPMANDRLFALERALRQPDPSDWSLRQAVILWATDPLRSPADGMQAAQSSAFAIAGSDPELLEMFARRAVPLLQGKPGLRQAFPKAADVERSIDASQPPTLQADLGMLVTLLTPPQPPADPSA